MPTAVLNIFGFFPWLNFFNFFNDAHHFVVERLTSISALFVTYIEAPKQDNTHIYRERLAGYVVTSALHDAGQTPLSRCLPETRVKVQEDMKNWIADIPVNGQPKTRFLWLTGPAGVGKTAIIGTIADRCKEERTLAASFFFSTFSGGPYRQSKARFISTLAYQLLNCVPEIEKKVLAAIERDPVIFDRGLDEQFRALILEPLRETVEESDSDPSIWRKIIFVDGLDECTAIQDPSASPKELRERTEAAHREILSVLFSAIKEPSFPFRIVLASRPEQVICQFFSTQKQWHIELFLDEKYNPSDDIKRFLEAKFHEIQQRYDLPDNWVPQSVIQLLVERASGQFIFAMVAIRFVEDGDELPQDQVQLLLRWCPEPSQLSESKPFDALDQLYTRILKTSPKHYLAIKWILAIDRLRREAPCPPAIVKDYLESAAGETQFLLGRLNSLVHVSKRNSDLPLFHLHHQSLLDFLADPRRSGDLYVGEDKVEEFLRGCWENILKSRGPHRCSGQYTAIPKDFVDWYFRLSSYQPTQVSETDMEWWDTAMGTRETVILLLGRSGAGKSHFINGLAGADLAPVSDCLLPPRDHFKVRDFDLTVPRKISIQKHQIILVDTPGFDSGYPDMDDGTILLQTAEFVKELKRCRPHARLGGIVYFQPITDDRPTPPLVDHFSEPELFRRLLVVLTKRDLLSTFHIAGERREDGLAKTVWRSALGKGATMGTRYWNTTTSAWAVLVQILKAQPLDIDVLQKDLMRAGEQLQQLSKQYDERKKATLKQFFSFLPKERQA